MDKTFTQLFCCYVL